AARSIHQGVELTGRAERVLGGGLSARLDANATLSDNHFVDYIEFDDLGAEFHLGGNQLGLFPATIANVALRVEAAHGWVSASTQSVSRICLDNTENKDRSLEPRTVLDLAAGARFRASGAKVGLTLRVLNAGDLRYSAGGYGYTYYGVRYAEVVPAATRAAMG